MSEIPSLEELEQMGVFPDYQNSQTHHAKGIDDNCQALIGLSIDNSIWMGGSPDWTALNIHLGANVSYAMHQAEKALNNWRLELNDQWNIHGIVAGEGYYFDGLPWCTSHYGFHMVLWHIPFSLSGQDYSSTDQSLSFSPKLDGDYQLPLLIPRVYGHIAVTSTGEYTLSILKVDTPLTLQSLDVNGVSYPVLPVTLKSGSTISWGSGESVDKNPINLNMNIN